MPCIGMEKVLLSYSMYTVNLNVGVTIVGGYAWVQRSLFVGVIKIIFIAYKVSWYFMSM